MRSPTSIDGVAFVERLDGPGADPDAPPALLVEVPHGADRRAHYDALRGRLRSLLPDDLHIFFHMNTDVGAWALGRRAAERVLAAHPSRSALLVRCLLPRTFVDTNRAAEAADELARGGLTAAIPPYVDDPADITLLSELHRAYEALTERAYAHVCSSGGLALTPHTYGPRSVGIERVDETIVEQLRRTHEPDAWRGWPIRPEVDLITRDADGRDHAPVGIAAELEAGYEALGVNVAHGSTYYLHPSTQAHRWSVRYPGQVLCLEVRRDLLVGDYTPFEEMIAAEPQVDRMAGPVADALIRRLD